MTYTLEGDSESCPAADNAVAADSVTDTSTPVRQNNAMTRYDRKSAAVRLPAVAGQFYPDDPADLQAAVEYYLARCQPIRPAPKAIIAPHAGYIFSGPVAANAYAGWHDLDDSVRRVILLGPAHCVYLRGLALPTASAFMTPLGNISLDQDMIADLGDLPGICMDDRPHADEHSLEVQLPFLQTLFADFMLVPIVVGDVPAKTVAGVLERLWGGPETRIVISTDLSHYHSYAAAREIDSATSAAICALQAEAISPEQACGCMPLRGLLHFAREHGLHVRELDRRNSGDTAGPRDRVVGYGAYAVMN